MASERGAKPTETCLLEHETWSDLQGHRMHAGVWARHVDRSSVSKTQNYFLGMQK